jgi:hypothetical protein
MRNLEKSNPVFWTWDRRHWIMTCVLAFCLGAALANGYATHQALKQQWANCEWTIGHELKRQRSSLESQ